MVAAAFEALAEPNRRRILDLLARSERTVGDLVGALSISQPAVSKHLRVLRDAGLVDVRADAQHRIYTVRTEPLQELDAWLAPFRRMWERRLDALERHLDTMAESEQGGVMQGELEQVGGRWSVRFVRSLAHPPERVWAALTEPAHLAAWFPSGIEGERAAGARLRLAFPNDFVPAIDGEMLVYDPPRTLEFTWGGDTLRFELEPEPSGTRLTLIDTLEELGKAARDAGGWHACLDALALHLAGRDATEARTNGWRAVHGLYIERFGPEASRIGPPEGMTLSD